MLTREERRYAIERALDHIAGRFVERAVREALARGDSAAAVARALCGNWGAYGGGWVIEGMRRGGGKGLYVRTPAGREGLIRWEELVAHARGVHVQLSLFDAAQA